LNPLRPTVIIACLALATGGEALQDDAEDDQPPVRQLLEDVIARLPRESLRIQGDLTVRKRRGLVLTRLKFDTSLDLGATPSLARYTILDAFGTELEQMTVTRREGEPPEFSYAAGSPLAICDTPDLCGRIGETDLSWIDLTLSFLWWPDGSPVGSGEIRGRPCHVVELTNPSASGTGELRDDPVAPYARVRLWIDKKMHMLLQAEALDAESKPIRRLWVKSFKKINDRWMLKDMEVEGVPAAHRTKLTIREVGVAPSP